MCPAGVRREQSRPTGAKHRGARYRHSLGETINKSFGLFDDHYDGLLKMFLRLSPAGHRTSPYTAQSDLTNHGHEFAVPQQPGKKKLCENTSHSRTSMVCEQSLMLIFFRASELAVWGRDWKKGKGGRAQQLPW